MASSGFFVKCPQCEARTKVTERGLKAQPLVACRCGVAFMPQVSAGAGAGRDAVVVLDADGFEVERSEPPKRLALI